MARFFRRGDEPAFVDQTGGRIAMESVDAEHEAHVPYPLFMQLQYR